MKKLAICIPTYNRSKLVDRLLSSIPSTEEIMVSVCDDGSDDNTHEIVKNHQSRISIKYQFQKNKGRASSLRKSIQNSEGEFVMIADSDDYFTKNGIENILKTIKENSSLSFFVFPTKIVKKFKSFDVKLQGIPETNYISLRSDYKVKNDLQEVIHHKLLFEVLYEDPKDIRRIPTSYLWFKASMKVNCFPVDCQAVKVKEYLSDGMTENLLPLKVRYPKYLVYTYKTAIESNQYTSSFYRLKYTILFYRYSFHYKKFKLLRYQDFPLFLFGYIYGFFDLLRLAVSNKK